jgi:hypothetical protein
VKFVSFFLAWYVVALFYCPWSDAGVKEKDREQDIVLFLCREKEKGKEAFLYVFRHEKLFEKQLLPHCKTLFLERSTCFCFSGSPINCFMLLHEHMATVLMELEQQNSGGNVSYCPPLSIYQLFVFSLKIRVTQGVASRKFI